MTGADDRILEFFDQYPIALPPSVLTYHLNYSKVHINNRMRKLADEGLLEKVDPKRGFYEITNIGTDYLRGDLSRDDLENSG
jgi:predicted transcriptional regulator